MGASQSSLPSDSKLRRILLVKTFNSRPSDVSVVQYFGSYFDECDEQGTGSVAFDDCRLIATQLGIEQSPKLEEFLQRFDAHQTGEFHYDNFLAFVEPPTATSTGAVSFGARRQRLLRNQRDTARRQEDGEGEGEAGVVVGRVGSNAVSAAAAVA